MRRLLLFDIDGTLLASRGRGLRSMHAAFQEVFARPAQPVTLVPHGKTDPMLFEEMASAYAVSAETLQEHYPALMEAYAQRLEQALREPHSVELKPGVRARLDVLRARDDVTLGIVSGNLERTAWLKLAAAGLDDSFSGGAFGSDGRERRALVALAMARLGVASPPSQHSVWVIGDTPADVDSARANGVRALAVATGMHDAPTLRACGADAVLHDLSDVTRAVDILCTRA